MIHFLKSRIFIQKSIHFFLKEAVSSRAMPHLLLAPAAAQFDFLKKYILGHPASKPHTNSWRWCFGFNANTNGDDDSSEPGCLGVHFSTAQTCFCAGNPLCRDYTKILNVEMCNTSQFTFFVIVMNLRIVTCLRTTLQRYLIRSFFSSGVI